MTDPKSCYFPLVHTVPDVKSQNEQNKVFSEEIPAASLPDTITQIHLILRM